MIPFIFKISMVVQAQHVRIQKLLTAYSNFLSTASFEASTDIVTL